MVKSRSIATSFTCLAVMGAVFAPSATLQVQAEEQKPLLVRKEDTGQRNQNRRGMRMEAAMPSLPSSRVNELIDRWQSESQKVVRTIMQKYGSPQGGTSTMLIWHRNGPWKQTIVYRDPIQHNFPKPHHDLLEQFINYQVPPRYFSDLAAYDGSVIAERTKGEISARCDKEEMNFLALNLAHDIVNGKRSVNEARQFYAMTAMDFMNGGKPPYTQGLQFDVDRETNQPDHPMMPPPMRVSELVESWPDPAKEVAQTTIKKYGQPDEATAAMLVWHRNGPWKRTIVYRDEVRHDFPKPHRDLLEQFIDYRVPTRYFSDLAAYDGSVIAERTKGEISARCDKEEMNFLALNLAHDIVNGKRSVKDARQAYAQMAMAFMKGEKPPYTQGLQFDVPKGDTADPDQQANMRDRR